MYMNDIPKIAKVAKIQSKHLDSVDQKLLEILLKRGGEGVSYKELADELNIKSNTTVGRRAKNLQMEGLVYIYKKNRNNFVKWIGGTPTLESELIRATNEHVRASLLSEYYDSMVTNAYAPFLLLFEDHYWEIIMNLTEGLTDLELGQRLGNAITLDSIRRVLATCDYHDIIKLDIIRDPAGNDPLRMFEPLYRIKYINTEYLEYFVVIRGLASAAITKMGGKLPDGYTHLYESLLDIVISMFLSLQDKAISNENESDNELLKRMILNYDFAPDVDRVYKTGMNWRKLLKHSSDVRIDDKTDLLIINKELSQKYEKAMIRRVVKK